MYKRKINLTLLSIIGIAALSFLLITPGCGRRNSGGDGGNNQVGSIATSNMAPETEGFVKVRLKDFPINGQDVEHVYITVNEVSIGTDTRGWTVVNNTQQEYDLLKLVNNATAVLGRTKIPVGTYDQIRLILSNTNRIVVNGQEHTLKIPSGQQSGIKLNGPFDIKTCAILEIVLDFNAEKSITYTNGSGYILKPVIQIASVATVPPEQCLGDRVIKTGTWNGQQVEYVTGIIPFKLKSGHSLDSIQTKISPVCGQIQDFNKWGNNIGHISFPDNAIDTFSIITMLKTDPSIEWAEPDMVGHASATPNDPSFSKQWALKNTGQVNSAVRLEPILRRRTAGMSQQGVQAR